MKPRIENERPEDAAAIRAVVSAAFLTMPYGQQTEAAIVDALRKAGAMAVSLVAVVDEHVVGHVAFSPITIDGAEARGWYGVGPVSVHPDYQQKGIGTALMKAGLEKIAAMNGAGCVLVGEPDYYSRFGFVQATGLTYPDAPAEYFMLLPLSGAIPTGKVEFHDGFSAR